MPVDVRSQHGRLQVGLSSARGEPGPSSVGLDGGAAPFISVIVPTFNRLDSIPALVSALEKQRYPTDLFEVLIVDDGSTDGTFQYLSGLRKLNFRVFSQEHSGASRARNLGAVAARGEILAFTDDDCIPDDGWLRTIERSCGRYPDTALLGNTFSEHPASTFVHSVFKTSEPVVTCNFAVPRRVFERIGGFDPFYVLYFEDEDLGLRIRKAGVKIVCEPAMRVLHPSKYQSFGGFLRLRRGLEYFCYMSQKHPDCDHWARHHAVVTQIWKKVAFVGIPSAAAIVWPPAFLAVLVVVSTYIVRDGVLAAAYRRQLARRGFHLRAADMLAFTLLNWAVPLMDGVRVVKGYLRTYGEVSAWTASPIPPKPAAPHVRIIRAVRMLLSRPGLLARRVYRRCRLRLPHASIQSRRFGDVRLELDVRDPMMKSMFQDLYEVDEVACLENIIRPGDTVFDVGANIGFLTAVSASIVGRTGQVHAFEPLPELYSRLEHFRRMNPAYDICLTSAAAGAGTDWMNLSVSRDGNRGWNTLVPGFMPEEQSSGGVRVRVISLDEYVAERGIVRLDFIKIDVEGFEFPVLEGLRRTLENLRPVVLCEIAPDAYPRVGHRVDELEAFLGDLSYRCFDVRMNPVRISDLGRTMNVVMLPPHRLRF